ncbi:MAG TPA: ABC transporter ATP-binding protein [Anaeromyxobacteraceae bacterium]|nr:ABC transporter ATP-binding protein [Anaeromyxobacteraceae bacterium]
MAEASPVLELRGVTKDFGAGEARAKVLQGVDFTLRRGEFAALVGPSGSGKSTLLNIMGLLDRPTTGRVLVCGEDTAKLGDEALTRYRGRAIGFVFQFHHLLPEFTALENVMLPMAADRGRLDDSMRECGAVLLDLVGLRPKLHARATELSGGQAQRVAIARSLAMNPRVVLADEPTGNLDTQTSDEVFAMLRDVNRRQGVTFLVVTHDSRLAARCDRIIDLVDGRVVSDRPNRPLP